MSHITLIWDDVLAFEIGGTSLVVRDVFKKSIHFCKKLNSVA